ncbi:SIMPL domain-containing protein [Idiomarina seosinensis]|uniref:SIMPL domain-containing protein n=1 Tax=Idiomarina seosinensis TaxID=281739 RepID=UPI0038512EB5
MKHSDPFWKPTLILTACLLLLMTFTSAAQSNAANGIKVTGSASIKAVPDQASISFTVEHSGQKLNSLKTQVDQVSRKLIDILVEKKVEKTNIRSYRLQVYPRYQNNDGKSRHKDFVVRRSIEVTLDSLDNYDQIIDLALAQGVTRVDRIQFRVSDQHSLYQQALQQAFKDARKKALGLAKTAQLQLGSAVRIEEQSRSQPAGMQIAEMSTRRQSPSLPGQQEIEARIDVYFEIMKATTSER